MDAARGSIEKPHQDLAEIVLRELAGQSLEAHHRARHRRSHRPHQRIQRALRPVIAGEFGAQQFYLLPPLDGAIASSSRAYARSAWVAFSIACLVMAAVVASWHALREWKAALVALLLGLASVAAMGFSPTAYASGSRIYFVCQVALLLVALRLVAGVEREFGSRAANVGMVVVAVAAGYRVLRLLGWI